MNWTGRVGLLAAAAVGLVALAGAAQAQGASFKASVAGSPVSSATLEQHVFSLSGAQVKCKTVKLEGKTPGTEYSEQNVQPTYEGCEGFGFTEGVEVNTAGCEFGLPAATNEEAATLALKNCTNGGITIRVSNIFAQCHVIIKNQFIPKSVTYTNTPTDIHVRVKATTIHVEVLKSTGLCPLVVGTYTFGSYSGVSTVGPTSGSLQYIP